MKYNGILPPDPTAEELKVLDSLVADFYRVLTDPMDKLIFALRYDLGYGWEDISAMIGFSQVTVMHHIRKIKDVLEGHHSNRLYSNLDWSDERKEWVSGVKKTEDKLPQ